jgi:hypothetical protein
MPWKAFRQPACTRKRGIHLSCLVTADHFGQFARRRFLRRAP